jgi:CRP-like cAMP-binding protein
MKFYNHGEIVYSEEDPIDKIIFVVNGFLEIYTEFEGNEFIIETLTPGSILNYRTVFTEDKMQVQVRSR